MNPLNAVIDEEAIMPLPNIAAGVATIATIATGVLAVASVIPSLPDSENHPLHLTADTGFPYFAWGPEGGPTDVVRAVIGNTIDTTQVQQYANYFITADTPTSPELTGSTVPTGNYAGTFLAHEQIVMNPVSGWGNEHAVISDANSVAYPGGLVNLNGHYTDTIITPWGNFTYGNIPADTRIDGTIFTTAIQGTPLPMPPAGGESVAVPGTLPVYAWLPAGVPTNAVSSPGGGTYDQLFANYAVTPDNPDTPVLATGLEDGAEWSKSSTHREK